MKNLSPNILSRNKPRKMWSSVKGVTATIAPDGSGKMTKAEKIDALIEETNGELFLLLGDNPAEEMYQDPKVVYLTTYMTTLLNTKERINRPKKNRKRHMRSDLRNVYIWNEEWTDEARNSNMPIKEVQNGTYYKED